MCNNDYWSKSWFRTRVITRKSLQVNFETAEGCCQTYSRGVSSETLVPQMGNRADKERPGWIEYLTILLISRPILVSFIFNCRIMLYSAVLVSAVPTVWISCKYTYIPPSWASLPSPSPLGHHRALSWAPCAIQQVPASSLFCTWWWMLSWFSRVWLFVSL